MMKMRHASLNACFRNTALNPTSGGIHNDATHVQTIRQSPYEMLVAPLPTVRSSLLTVRCLTTVRRLPNNEKLPTVRN